MEKCVLGNLKIYSINGETWRLHGTELGKQRKQSTIITRSRYAESCTVVCKKYYKKGGKVRVKYLDAIVSGMVRVGSKTEKMKVGTRREKKTISRVAVSTTPESSETLKRMIKSVIFVGIQVWFINDVGRGMCAWVFHSTRDEKLRWTWK